MTYLHKLVHLKLLVLYKNNVPFFHVQPVALPLLTTLEHIEVFFCHWAQKVSARTWTLFHWCLNMLPLVKSPGEGETTPHFWVRRAAGVKISGASESKEMHTKGLALIIAVTSAINVVRTSWVSLWRPFCKSMESWMGRAMPIIRSHVRQVRRVEHPGKSLTKQVVIHTHLTRLHRI